MGKAVLSQAEHGLFPCLYDCFRENSLCETGANGLRRVNLGVLIGVESPNVEGWGKAIGKEPGGPDKGKR